MPFLDTAKIKREAIKALLRPLVRWRPLRHPLPGFSLIIGVPWALRHVLAANLRFVRKMDLTGLHHIHIVFDRTTKPGADAFMSEIRETFPSLPLQFQFHPWHAGSIVRAVNRSQFYASLNWVLGLQVCRTRYAIIHDFDLYPTDPNMFRAIVRALEERHLRFSGTEIRMDKEWYGIIDPPTIGSCELGIDVSWLRENSHPVDCFHRIKTIRGTRCRLDIFNYVQLRTPARALADNLGHHSYAHVVNLCSTYLRFTTGYMPASVAWRLPFLWYLEDLSAQDDKLRPVTQAMDRAQSATLDIHGLRVDFSGEHVTCSNVLRDRTRRMEKVLFGQPRSEVEDYVDSFERFLERFGDTS